MSERPVKRIGVLLANSSMDVGGVFVYANGLINMLLNEQRVEQLVIFYSANQKDLAAKIAQRSGKVSLILVDVQAKPWKNCWAKAYNLCDGFYEAFDTFPFGKNFFRGLTRRMNPYRDLFDKAGLDLVHVPFQIAPVYGIATPVVITMHDVQEMHFPQFFTPQDRIKRAIAYKRSIEQSDHIIVSMQHIKLDILKYFKAPESKVSVCPLPFAQEWFQDTEVADSTLLKGKYGLKDPFILYPAMTWEHKNHRELIRAVHLLKEQGVLVQLICTGKKTEYYARIDALVKELGLESQVSFLGLVPESDLIGLYRSTNLVVIPTLYEAESQPFFEAMRYEAPVIASNVGALPECMNDVAFTFDPYQASEIAALIKKGCFDGAFRKRNIDNLRRRKAFYQQMKAPEAFLTAYQHARTNR